MSHLLDYTIIKLKEIIIIGDIISKNIIHNNVDIRYDRIPTVQKDNGNRISTSGETVI